MIGSFALLANMRLGLKYFQAKHSSLAFKGVSDAEKKIITLTPPVRRRRRVAGSPFRRRKRLGRVGHSDVDCITRFSSSPDEEAEMS
jgi:hypothetical protein